MSTKTIDCRFKSTISKYLFSLIRDRLTINLQTEEMPKEYLNNRHNQRIYQIKVQHQFPIVGEWPDSIESFENFFPNLEKIADILASELKENLSPIANIKFEPLHDNPFYSCEFPHYAGGIHCSDPIGLGKDFALPLNLAFANDINGKDKILFAEIIFTLVELKGCLLKLSHKSPKLLKRKVLIT